MLHYNSTMCACAATELLVESTSARLRGGNITRASPPATCNIIHQGFAMGFSKPNRDFQTGSLKLTSATSSRLAALAAAACCCVALPRCANNCPCRLASSATKALRNPPSHPPRPQHHLHHVDKSTPTAPHCL
jgi:hypothetical protein